MRAEYVAHGSLAVPQRVPEEEAFGGRGALQVGAHSSRKHEGPQP